MLGRHLGRTQAAFDTAHKRLSSGKGNLVNQAASLHKLGVKNKKELDKRLIDSASESDPDVRTTGDARLMISVVGYGSLLSEWSARQTVPGLQNFRLVRVPGYRRIFNKVGIVFLSRHGADPDSLQLASCSTQPVAGCEIICSQFECSAEEFIELYEREHRFRWIEVETVPLDRAHPSDTPPDTPSVGRMCTGL